MTLIESIVFVLMIVLVINGAKLLVSRWASLDTLGDFSSVAH